MCHFQILYIEALILNAAVFETESRLPYSSDEKPVHYARRPGSNLGSGRSLLRKEMATPSLQPRKSRWMEEAGRLQSGVAKMQDTTEQVTDPDRVLGGEIKVSRRSEGWGPTA